MSLRDLHTVQPVYVLPRDSLVTGVLIPGFREAESVDAMVGFFNSASLREIAPGLAEFLGRSPSKLRLIISPYISTSDQEAMKQGLSAPEVASARLEEVVGQAIVSERALVRHTLECLAFLIAHARLEIKVSLVRGGLFHPKVWLFRGDEDSLVVHGSSNMTNAGLTTNLEHVTVSRSWGDSTQAEVNKVLSEEFEALWNGQREYAVTFDLPKAISERIMRAYEGDAPPTSKDFFVAWKADADRGWAPAPAEIPEEALPSFDQPVFHIPAELNYKSGEYGYQGEAVTAWEKAGGRGIFEMATGAGKTIVSLVAAQRLVESKQEPLLIVMAAPYLPLVLQWTKEAQRFGLAPVVPGRQSSRSKKEAVVEDVVRRLKLGFSSTDALVVTHDFLCDAGFQEIVERSGVASLLIADEVHNLGRPEFLERPPEFFNFRIGLSATPERQFDPEGTEELLNYFGQVVFRFTLADAIGKSLVPYDYFIHEVDLTGDELEDWAEITQQLRRAGWSLQGKDESGRGFMSDRVRALLIRRRRILEEASGKIAVLRSLLEGADRRSIRHTLIYATDKGPDQLTQVNELLRDLGILYHQLTSEETARPEASAGILTSFARGELQVLTAKRVLDEGVDIPQITTAFILASTTVERQWVQRRGRVLRKAEGKTSATVHDFVVLPPLGVLEEDGDARKIVKQELERVTEFARLAKNAAAPGGPLEAVQPIYKKYFGQDESRGDGRGG